LNKLNQEKVIEKYAGQLRKLCDRIPGHFEEEDIHDWRVNYKKLRAFLRMVTTGVDGHLPVMTPEFKKIYAAAGQVRELQLFLATLKCSATLDLNALPVYHHQLEKQLFAAKEEFIKRTDVFSFEKETDRWMLMLPEYLDKKIILRFVQRKITAIRLLLLVTGEDEHLHSIRKNLKDIIYNIRTFSGVWGISFPVIAWKSEKQLAEIAEELGAYNDRCNALVHFEENILVALPETEKLVLQKHRDSLLLGKNIFKEQLLAQLKEPVLWKEARIDR
jgi:CHAD domain-containing protein